MANVALFLASDEASFVSGGSLTVDGGFHAGKRFGITAQMMEAVQAAGGAKPPPVRSSSGRVSGSTWGHTASPLRRKSWRIGSGSHCATAVAKLGRARTRAYQSTTRGRADFASSGVIARWSRRST